MVLECYTRWSIRIPPNLSETKESKGSVFFDQRHLSYNLEGEIKKTIKDEVLLDDFDHFPLQIFFLLGIVSLHEISFLLRILNLSKSLFLIMKLIAELFQIIIVIFLTFGFF
jgi:hypothetical protein